MGPGHSSVAFVCVFLKVEGPIWPLLVNQNMCASSEGRRGVSMGGWVAGWVSLGGWVGYLFLRQPQNDPPPPPPPPKSVSKGLVCPFQERDRGPNTPSTTILEHHVHRFFQLPMRQAPCCSVCPLTPKGGAHRGHPGATIKFGRGKRGSWWGWCDIPVWLWGVCHKGVCAI